MANDPIILNANEIPLLRTSERNDFKACPWLWEQTWLAGRGTRRTPVWSWFGSAIHSALEVRYPNGVKRGSLADTIDAFDAAVAGETGRIWTEGKEELEESEVVEAKDLGHAMLAGYVDHYGDDEEWEVIHTEQPFQIKVPQPGSKDALVVYCGTWDGLWRNRRTKEFWIIDHKTRKSFPTRWDFYDINDQAGSYLWVAPEILKFLGVFTKKDRIEGLVFNALKKQMPDTRPVDAQGRARNKPQKAHYQAALAARNVTVPKRATIRELQELADLADIPVLGDVSAVQPGPRYHRVEVYRTPEERVKQARRVQTEALAMEDVRTGRRKAWKTPTEDCVRCKIFEYCQVDEQSVEEGREFAQHMMVSRDYYADHRRAMELKGGINL